MMPVAGVETSGMTMSWYVMYRVHRLMPGWLTCESSHVFDAIRTVILEEVAAVFARPILWAFSAVSWFLWQNGHVDVRLAVCPSTSLLSPSP